MCTSSRDHISNEWLYCFAAKSCIVFTQIAKPLKVFQSNCFQMENILFGQFVILIVKMTYVRSISYCFSAPVKICYANEYMLVLHLNICVRVNKAICVEIHHGS